MVEAIRRLIPKEWTDVHRGAIAVAAVLLFYWANDWIESFRNDLTLTADVGATIWRWFVAAGLAALAGWLIGVGLREKPPQLPFNWRRALAVGLIPLLLALTLPAFYWNWPLLGSTGPVWSFRVVFTDAGYAGSMWMLVGLAIAGGFRFDGTGESDG